MFFFFSETILQQRKEKNKFIDGKKGIYKSIKLTGKKENFK